MKILLYISLAICFYSCGPRLYSYDYSMKESEKPRKLKYENDTVLIHFDFHLTWPLMEFTNKTGREIKIHWEKFEMKEGDSVRKIIHVHTDDRVNFENLAPPARIGSLETVSDLIVFADNVSYKWDGGPMKIKPIYPMKSKNSERDSVEQLVGRKIQLSFPIEINNVIQTLTFNFKLNAIESKRAINGWDVLLVPTSIY